MFLYLLLERLENSGLFQTAALRINSRNTHLVLYPTLKAIEEIDRGNDWNARLAMSLKLKAAGSETVLWQHHFDREQTVSSKDIYGVVETLKKLYNREMEQVLHELNEFLLSYTDCKA